MQGSHKDNNKRYYMLLVYVKIVIWIWHPPTPQLMQKLHSHRAQNFVNSFCYSFGFIAFNYKITSVLIILAVCESYYFCSDEEFHDIFTLLLN